MGTPPRPLDIRELPQLRLDLKAPDTDAAYRLAVVLADRSRSSILRLLHDGPHCVCEMAAALDERQNNISNHLARLREAGLVRAKRAGGDSRRIYYERDEAACRAALNALGELLL